MFYAEEHHGLENVFMVKFCLRQDRNAKGAKKFTRRVGDVSLARKVMETCVHIIADITREIHNASFGFIGQEDELDPERSQKNGNDTSRRFRVESFVSRNLIGEENYYHLELPKKNAYFIIHKSNDPIEFKARVVDKFNAIED